MIPRIVEFLELRIILRQSEQLLLAEAEVVESVFEDDTLEKATKMGAQGYIVKSDFERESLTAKVKELLHE